jgi:hypothetical protein
MKIGTRIAVIDEILDHSKTSLGDDAAAYRNHCYRVFHYCLALFNPAHEDEEKIAIAAAFHDLGIWEFRTFDYLDFSRKLAADYLLQNDLSVWAPAIDAMIENHHKCTPYRGADAALVNAFRKADWADVSMGWLRSGLRRDSVIAVRAAFPSLGFYGVLTKLALRRCRTHPLSPLPMMKL